METVPDELLVRIISWLPFKQQVSSCVVAKRWKELWKETGCLDFDYNSFWSGKKFVSTVVASVDRRRAPIRSFLLTFPEIFDAFFASSGWLMEIVNRSSLYNSLKTLTIRNFCCKASDIHSLLERFVCLEELGLENITVESERLKIGGGRNLTRLRRLRLTMSRSVMMICEEVIIVYAPNLVSLDFVGIRQKLSIYVPKLISFSYDGPWRRVVGLDGSSSSLSTVTVKLPSPNFLQISDIFLFPNYGCSDFKRDIFLDLAHIKVLQLNCSALHSFNMELEGHEEPLFSNLEVLVVCIEGSCTRICSGIFGLLQMSKNIQQLTVNVPETLSYQTSAWCCDGFPSGVACNLKSFKMSYIRGTDHEMLFLKALVLDNGGAGLRSIQVTTNKKMSRHIYSMLKRMCGKGVKIEVLTKDNPPLPPTKDYVPDFMKAACMLALLVAVVFNILLPLFALTWPKSLNLSCNNPHL